MRFDDAVATTQDLSINQICPTFKFFKHYNSITSCHVICLLFSFCATYDSFCTYTIVYVINVSHHT
jgi:hypothetical protein